MSDWLDNTGKHLARVDESLLPPVARRLIKVIGLRYTVRLLRARGGTMIKIPKCAQNASVLLEIMPLTAVTALCDSDFGNQPLDLPKTDAILNQFRNQAIREERAAGASIPSLALKYKLSRKWVSLICKETDEESKNLELFG